MRPTMATDTPPPSGPYESTRTSTFEITGPIKIVVTSVEKATHPPQPCKCGGGGAAQALIDQLLHTINGVGKQPPADDDDDDGSPPAH